MSILSDVIALKDAIAAPVKDWGSILSLFLKIIQDVQSGVPIVSFGAAADGSGSAEELKAAVGEVVACCAEQTPVQDSVGTGFGKLGDGKILQIIMTVLPLILKFI